MLRSCCALLFFLFLTAAPAVLPAQTVSITTEPGIDQLLGLFMDQSETETKVDGWRVQILATTDRNRLNTVESEFKVNYPSVPVDWVHTKPYYKLRAGAFQTKQEAERLKFTLNRQFEGVYLVKDQVGESELLRMY